MRGAWRWALAAAGGLLACGPGAAWAGGAQVESTRLHYKATVTDKFAAARASLLSALENKNFTVVNELNVQQGLKNRGIESEPVLLVEFINLSKAYRIASSNRAFELFAPLRAALFEEKAGGTTILIMRPSFIKAHLESEGLSPDAVAALDEFEGELQAILKDVAAGGF